MSYRPISDVWLLTRCKYRGGAKRYGGYPGGFLERARALLGVGINDPILHVCAGMVRDYPYRGGYGPYDATLDLDPSCEPTFLQSCLDPLPRGYRAILADPPYSAEDAAHYAPGAEAFPSAQSVLRRMLEAVEPGRRVGILHYAAPRPPKETRFVANIAVSTGFDNKMRAYAVYERAA